MDGQKINVIADAEEAKEIYRISIHEIGIPSMVLMERAAMSVAACIREQSDPAVDRILAVCGTGNNGGDGVAIARILWEAGYSVSVLIIGQMGKCSDEMKQQITIAERIGMSILTADSRETASVVTEEKLEKYTIVIDAIFGIGLSREIRGNYRELTPLQAVKDNNPKTLITFDDSVPINHDGIKQIYAIDWLTEGACS